MKPRSPLRNDKFSVEKYPFLDCNLHQQRQLMDIIRRAVVFQVPSSPRSMALAHHLHFHSNKLLALSSETKSSTKYPVSKGLKSRSQIKKPHKLMIWAQKRVQFMIFLLGCVLPVLLYQLCCFIHRPSQ